jgi:NAD(P)-dependent dehydrogenase (short-subunit alcohol dehydrogenase family)
MTGRLFDGKVALVTGGASGIGRAAALRFAEEGARVVVADIDLEGAEGTAAAIHELDGGATAVRTDVTSLSDIRAMVDHAVDRFGRLDIAFNNAGHPGRFTNVVDCSEEEWDYAISVNARSVWLCMKYEIPAMLAAGGGAIVNTASAACERAPGHMVSYLASKHAVIGLTKSAAVDFGPRNIRVSALLPGTTLTPMMERGFVGTGITAEQYAAATPIGRLGRADEQADAVIWLCSDRSSFVNGICLLVDGGVTLTIA